MMMSALCAVRAQDVLPVVHVDNPPNLLAQQAKHYVILVSLDGFRYDYERKFGAPHLAEMAREGASTPQGMLPSYPSTTFPNHYALATGLRPEHNGMAAMEFYDPDRKTHFLSTEPSSVLDGSWYQGTPLWVLAEQQGMRSASLFWVGSESEIEGVRPSYYLHFDDKLDDAKRVQQVAQWLALPPEQRPHMITVYYSNVDHAGHNFGPDADETRDAVHHVDEIVGRLQDAIVASGLPVDLIVTADHGMSKLARERVVLDSFADLTHFHTEGALLYADTEADAERAYEQFRAHPDPRFTAYRRLQLPAELHYVATARAGDPVIVANMPVAVSAHAVGKPPLAGSHGFDPHRFPEMKAIFYAEGPDIKAGVQLKSFDNVDVFSFVAALLGLQAPPNDGEISPLKSALKR